MLLVSDTEAQAISFLGDIKTEFYENDELIRAFGFKRFVKDREGEIIGEFEDGHKFRILAKGSEQRVRGIKWRNQRPDLIIGDDLEDDETVMNEERRHKFSSWFRKALLPCGSDTCHVRIVGTILHMDSMLENLMPDTSDPDTVVEGLREYNLNPNNSWISARYRAHTGVDDYSEILWPEQFSAKRLQSIQKEYFDAGIPDGYSQEYLNYPIDFSTALFAVEDFKPIGDEAPEEIYISADLAISEKKARAYSVFEVAGITSDNTLRYRSVIRQRTSDARVLVDTLFTLVELYKPEMVIIEKENIAATIKGTIEREMEERNLYFRLELPTPTKDKVARARPLQLRMKAGKVEWDMDAPWFPSLQEEFLHFPRGKYKDQVDTAAWIPYLLQKINSAPTISELEEEEYEDEYNTTYSMFGNNGVCSTTGY